MNNQLPLILAVDPGSSLSAYIVGDMSYGFSEGKGIVENYKLLELLPILHPSIVVIEELKSYGMPFGQSLIDTCYFVGRLIQACASQGIDCKLICRKTVVNTLIHGVNGNDKSIRHYLINRYGVDKTKGVVKDIWSALAIYTAYLDLNLIPRVQTTPHPPYALATTGEGIFPCLGVSTDNPRDPIKNKSPLPETHRENRENKQITKSPIKPLKNKKDDFWNS